MIKNWNKFNESNSNVDYEEVFRNFKNGGGFTNQYWYAELSDGSILDCGYGLVEDEFNGDTWFEIGKLDELDDENNLEEKTPGLENANFEIKNPDYIVNKIINITSKYFKSTLE